MRNRLLSGPNYVEKIATNRTRAVVVKAHL
jgi:hypothetical protein